MVAFGAEVLDRACIQPELDAKLCEQAQIVMSNRLEGSDEGTLVIVAADIRGYSESPDSVIR